jgi:hypothetical protein
MLYAHQKKLYFLRISEEVLVISLYNSILLVLGVL